MHQNLTEIFSAVSCSKMLYRIGPWSIWVMNVSFELCEEVERQLELLEDVKEFAFRRWLRPHGQHAITEILLLRFPAPATFLQFSECGGGVLQPRDELLDVVEAAVQDGDVAFVSVARGGAKKLSSFSLTLE